MLNGKLVDQDTAEKIRCGGNHKYTKKLIDSIPKISVQKKVQLDQNLDKLIEVKSLLKIIIVIQIFLALTR